MQSARPAIPANTASLRPGSQPPTAAVYPTNQPIMMTMAHMPFPSPQPAQYYIPQVTHTLALYLGAFEWVCVLVCVWACLYLLHAKDQNSRAPSKVRTFWLVSTTPKACVRVNTWVGGVAFSLSFFFLHELHILFNICVFTHSLAVSPQYAVCRTSSTVFCPASRVWHLLPWSRARGVCSSIPWVVPPSWTNRRRRKHSGHKITGN